ASRLGHRRDRTGTQSVDLASHPQHLPQHFNRMLVEVYGRARKRKQGKARCDAEFLRWLWKTADDCGIFKIRKSFRLKVHALAGLCRHYSGTGSATGLPLSKIFNTM